jgi:hypothetical protein
MWKDKRDKKKQKTNEQQGETGNYELNNYQIGSKKFEEYYRAQFADVIHSDEEF